jgi:hypothetical protein
LPAPPGVEISCPLPEIFWVVSSPVIEMLISMEVGLVFEHTAGHDAGAMHTDAGPFFYLPE